MFFRRQRVVCRCQPHLGTFVTVELASRRSRRALLEASNMAFAEVARVEKKMSFFNKEGELSLFNEAGLRGESIALSDDMAAVLGYCSKLHVMSGGAFDPAKSCHIKGVEGNSISNLELDGWVAHFKGKVCLDLGGVAKGYAVDCAYEVVRSMYEDMEVMISAGGDMRMSAWKGEMVRLCVGEEKQLVPQEMLAEALATSAASYSDDGEYAIEAPNEVGNREKPKPRSVSVFAPCCMVADSLTKVLLLQGKKANLECFGAFGVEVI